MKYQYIDGQKSFTLDQYRPEAWTWLSGGPDSGVDKTAHDYYKAVPWLYRGVGLRANAVASLPFDLVEESTGTVVMTDGEWVDEVKKPDMRRGKDKEQVKHQEAIAFMCDPYKLLWLLEASQTLSGKAYIFRVANKVRTDKLRYAKPNSIKPIFNKDTGFLEAFERTIGSEKTTSTKYPYNEKTPLANKIMYFWLDDPDVEIGEPTAWPAKSALAAAGVLYNMDDYIQKAFLRGLLKPLLLAVKGNPGPSDQEKIENRFNEFITGVKNAFRTLLINADSVDPIVLGDGLKELENTELSMEKRQDISTALGIPQTILFSDGAGGIGGGGVVEQDDKRFYLTTVIPAFNGLVYELNRQLLIPLGYRIVEQHERMEMFQEDEKDASAAMVNLTSAVATDPLAAKFSSIVLGMEIPEEAKKLLEEMIKQKDENRERMAEMGPPQPFGGNAGGNGAKPDDQISPKRDPEEKTALLDDLGKWQRKAAKLLERGKDACCPFESMNIPAALNVEVVSMLAEVKNITDLREVFDSVKSEQVADYGDNADLVDALLDATAALREKGSDVDED